MDNPKIAGLSISGVDSPRSVRGSTAVTLLEEAYALIRAAEPCLPEAVFIVLPAGTRRKRGHFHGLTWLAEHSDGREHEIAIHPSIFGEPEQVLATLLHEAAHALLFKWGMNGGCSVDGYHREEFRRVSETLGLECRFADKRTGWTTTGWPTGGVPDRWKHIVELLRALPPGTPPMSRVGRRRRNLAGLTRV